jgi:hypothetical protein
VGFGEHVVTETPVVLRGKTTPLPIQR